MRLARYMSMAGVASRRASEELIRKGKVTVNGEKITEVATVIDPGSDKVSYKGKSLFIQKYKYYLLNKPTGYVCSASDPFNPQTVFKIMPRNERLFNVGRLDKNSEGLLLMTNDGEFANTIMHPRYELEKRYRVVVQGRLRKQTLEDVCRDGITYEGIKYNPISIVIRKKTRDGVVLMFTLAEGKKREIRRICRALDLKVTALKRTQIGSLKLGEVPTGMYRELQPEEVEGLLGECKRAGRK